MPVAFLDALAVPATSSETAVLNFLGIATALLPFSLAVVFTAAVLFERVDLRGRCRWEEDGSWVVAAWEFMSGVSESLVLCCSA